LVSKYRCFALARRHGFGLQLKQKAIASVLSGAMYYISRVRFLGDLGGLPRNTKFNAEPAEAEKDPSEAVACSAFIRCDFISRGVRRS